MKTCENCTYSYYGYGESSCVACFRCSEYDESIDCNRATDCPHFEYNAYFLLQKQKEKLERTVGHLKRRIQEQKEEYDMTIDTLLEDIEKLQSLLGKLVCAVEDSNDSDNWNHAKKAYIENLDEILEIKKGV